MYLDSSRLKCGRFSLGILKSGSFLIIFQVLLLDEVTVDLDVVARMDLLEFFKEECEQVWHSRIYLLLVITHTHTHTPDLRFGSALSGGNETCVI